MNDDRLVQSVFELGKAGALPGGGVSRMAFTDADKAGRDYVKARMRELGMGVRVDGIGNIFGTYPGREELPPVMLGSHIDTVAAAGLYDGNCGVLAALEVAASLRDGGVVCRRPLVVAVFANEEGVRFQPDMMGSLVFSGGMALDEALSATDIDGIRLEDALARIEPERESAAASFPVDCFVELHIEQGPVLDAEGIGIGVVEAVQGISWSEFTVTGVANHAGTTPMRMRHDAGYAAAKIMAHAHELAVASVDGLVATVGRVSRYEPGMLNVIADRVTFTLDMRCADDAALHAADAEIVRYADEVASREGVAIVRRVLERFSPVTFSPDIRDRIAAVCGRLGLTHRSLPSGAVHDARMLAEVCPAGMVFIPNRGGLSHNVNEYVEPPHLVSGAEVLYHVAVELLDRA